MRAALKIRPGDAVVDEAPNFKSRSALDISPGLYRMRNGHTANVKSRKDLPYTDSAGLAKVYPIWWGICVECGEPKTWNVNGTYSPVAKHANDLMVRL